MSPFVFLDIFWILSLNSEYFSYIKEIKIIKDNIAIIIANIIIENTITPNIKTENGKGGIEKNERIAYCSLPQWLP